MKAGRGGDKPRSSWSGAIAQLGERLHGMQEVRGSTPLGSTIFLPDNSGDFYAVFSVSSLIPAAPTGRFALQIGGAVLCDVQQTQHIRRGRDSNFP